MEKDRKVFNGYRVLVLCNENVPDIYRTVGIYVHTTELCILDEKDKLFVM